jgi:tetratricopeptide (TPR) repeat protein
LAKYDRASVLEVMSAVASNYRNQRWTRCEAICATILGRCALPKDPAGARRELNASREYAARSGNMEVALGCFHLAAELARHVRNFGLAIAEAQDGIQVADSCGFGRWSLDIRIELAKAHLAAGSLSQAIEPAEWVLKRSREEDCKYAWGAADSLHLLGVAHARLGEQQKARKYLQWACEQRRALKHPGIGETEAELRLLGA